VTFEWADLITVLILIGLEGILSGDNALVLAVLVLPLNEEQQRKALRYGILGAFILRAIATLMAVWLANATWVALLGGAYLLYLPWKHFTQHPDEEPTDAEKAAMPVTGIFGLSLFWATVIRVELTDLVFAVDSILVAVAMTDKTWVIITGGILGILMMRMLTLQVLALVRQYPKLIDGAYIIVAWVGVKLLWEYLHESIVMDGHHVLPAIPKWMAIGVVIVLFIGSYLYARAHPEDPGLEEAALEAQELFGHRLAEANPSPASPQSGQSDISLTAAPDPDEAERLPSDGEETDRVLHPSEFKERENEVSG
jgi:YkoY family integral membrane protein